MNAKMPLYLLLIVLLLAAAAPHAYAQQTTEWQVNYQHVILNVDPSGQVAMQYEIDAKIVQGVWTEVWIPLSDSNQQVSSVVDGNGQQHNFHIGTDSSGVTDIMVEGFNLNPGDHVSLKVYSTISPFVYQADKAGYDIVSFTPVWWDMDVPEMNVTYYLPAVIPAGDVFTGQRQYSNIFVQGNQTVVFFYGQNLSPNEQFDTAVSFPDSYMTPGVVTGTTNVAPSSNGIGGIFTTLSACLCPGIFILFVIIFIVAGIGVSFNRAPYSSPVVSMDGIGVNKNLDPAEAATLLRIDPRRVLTMIMFGMMKKGNVKLLSTDPIRLEMASRQGLNYYEKLYADAIVNDQLSEDKLLDCFKVLARRVVDKTRPYCRKDTEEYYKSKIDEAWSEIQAVDTPELKLQKYDTNMFWLMADEQFTQKTTDYVARAPGSDTFRVPSYYWWYPYYFGLPHYYSAGAPHPAPAGGQPTMSQPGKAPAPAPTNQTTASMESFAKSISNSVESTSAGVATGVEKFLGVRNAANAPPPARTLTPGPSTFSGKSSCACVSCACACVSCACACACAGGGHGCT